MTYLFLNIVFASSFLLVIKWVQNREKEDIVVVGAINYIVAAVWTAPEFLQNGVASLSLSAVVTGGTMGLSYFVAFFLVIYVVKWIGASSATVISVLSIILPIACGVIIWNERPNGFQVIGVILALFALSLIGGQRSGGRAQGPTWFAAIIMISFFLLAGVSRLAQEAFKHTSQPEQRPTFLFAAFVLAAIPSVVLLLRSGKFSLVEFLFGFAMGASNILQTHFILKALAHFEGFVVFPITSGGSLILTTVVATKLLGEQLNRKTYLGIAIAVTALFLLNWVQSP